MAKIELGGRMLPPEGFSSMADSKQHGLEKKDINANFKLFA
jgi:hypothetical protein